MGRATRFPAKRDFANRSLVVLPSLTFRTEVQRVQIPAKKASGRLSSKANHTGGREPSGMTSFSANDVLASDERDVFAADLMGWFGRTGAKKRSAS